MKKEELIKTAKVVSMVFNLEPPIDLEAKPSEIKSLIKEAAVLCEKEDKGLLDQDIIENMADLFKDEKEALKLSKETNADRTPEKTVEIMRYVGLLKNDEPEVEEAEEVETEQEPEEETAEEPESTEVEDSSEPEPEQKPKKPAKAKKEEKPKATKQKGKPEATPYSATIDLVCEHPDWRRKEVFTELINMGFDLETGKGSAGAAYAIATKIIRKLRANGHMKK